MIVEVTDRVVERKQAVVDGHADQGAGDALGDRADLDRIVLAVVVAEIPLVADRAVTDHHDAGNVRVSGKNLLSGDGKLPGVEPDLAGFHYRPVPRRPRDFLRDRRSGNSRLDKTCSNSSNQTPPVDHPNLTSTSQTPERRDRVCRE